MNMPQNSASDQLSKENVKHIQTANTELSQPQLNTAMKVQAHTGYKCTNTRYSVSPDQPSKEAVKHIQLVNTPYHIQPIS